MPAYIKANIDDLTVEQCIDPLRSRFREIADENNLVESGKIEFIDRQHITIVTPPEVEKVDKDQYERQELFPKLEIEAAIEAYKKVFPDTPIGDIDETAIPAFIVGVRVMPTSERLPDDRNETIQLKIESPQLTIISLALLLSLGIIRKDDLTDEFVKERSDWLHSTLLWLSKKQLQILHDCGADKIAAKIMGEHESIPFTVKLHKKV